MIPVLSIVGWSNSGKTTLIENLLPEFNRRGLKVGVVKHASHRLVMDMAGKDSHRHKQAGADTIMVLSPEHMLVLKDIDINHESSLENSLSYLHGLDIVITEGFKRGKWPKIEVFRSEIQYKQPICLNDPNLIAIVSDIKLESNLPQFRVNDTLKISTFITGILM